MIDGIPNIRFATIDRTVLYNEMGFPISDPHAEEGFDINGFPVSRVVAVIIDGEIVKV